MDIIGNFDWLGYIFLGMFGLGVLIIFVAFILMVIWFMIPGHKHHRR